MTGSTRPHPTVGHGRRRDLDGFPGKVSRRPSGEAIRIVVVGAGVSGLACGRTLADHGHEVTVLEKARGPGGRAATRREDEWRFDHGAQYFTVRDERFRRVVESWRADGLVARWDGRIGVLTGGRAEPKDDGPERLVGVPGMNAICRHLGHDLEIVTGVRVASIVADGDGWRVSADDGGELGWFDAVVVSAPPLQSAALLELAAPDLAARAAAVPMTPCWAMMVVFGEPVGLDLDGAFVAGGPLSWVARNRSKPGRPDGEAWVLHATPEWSTEHLEDEPEAVGRALLGAFRSEVGSLPDAVLERVHRWRFAQPPEPLSDACLFDADLGIAACGDWCGGPRVEGAFLSGVAAAERLLALDAPGSSP